MKRIFATRFRSESGKNIDFLVLLGKHVSPSMHMCLSQEKQEKVEKKNIHVLKVSGIVCGETNKK